MEIAQSLNSKGEITIAAWVQELRDLKKVKFIVIRDGTGVLQVLLKDESDELKKAFESLGKEDYIEVKGKLVDSKVAKLGKEMIPSSIKTVSKSEQPFPIDISGKIESNLDTRIDWRFLDMRAPKNLAVFKLQSKAVNTMSSFLCNKGFTNIFSSKLVGSATEGGTEYFTVDYFKRKAYLAQSPQFYKEMALASGLNKVFEVGHVYRAEPHFTTRHLCEYVSFDLEFVNNSMDEVMDLEEEMLRDLFKELNKIGKEELELWGAKLLFPKKIPRVHFNEAKKIVEKMGVKTEEGDLTPAGERALCEWALKEKESEFVFLTHFPFKHKVFYAKKEGAVDALSFDLLYRGIEITTGGSREENFEKRSAQMKEKKLNPNDFDHMRFFKYGMPPHGGLAIGVERLVSQILGLANVRDACLTPRDPVRLTP